MHGGGWLMAEPLGEVGSRRTASVAMLLMMVGWFGVNVGVAGVAVARARPGPAAICAIHARFVEQPHAEGGELRVCAAGGRVSDAGSRSTWQAPRWRSPPPRSFRRLSTGCSALAGGGI